MFIATMYSYGSDANCVGLDCIRGCMGVFLSYRNMLYAIHVPENLAVRNDMGRHAFLTYVKQQIPNFSGSDASLYCVVNNTNRNEVEREMFEYCQDFFIGRVTLIRLQKHLGPSPSQPDGAAVLCERKDNNVCTFKYMKYDDVKWGVGVGAPRAGYYFNASFTDVKSTGGAVSQGWNVVDSDNSTTWVKEFF